MRRWLVPAILLIMFLMLDTSVLPFITDSVYLVSLSLVFVMVSGICMGRMFGMLYGFVSGLLIDILVGYPLGFMMFMYLGIGFLTGLMAYEYDEEGVKLTPKMLYTRRILTLFGVLTAYELIIMVYQYFLTSQFEMRYVLNAVVRIALGTALTLLLKPPLFRLMLGKKERYETVRVKREVKSF